MCNQFFVTVNVDSKNTILYLGEVALIEVGENTICLFLSTTKLKIMLQIWWI